MSKNSKPNRWLSLINMPIQMGVTIYLFHLLGTWLDNKYNLVDGLANKICTLLGVGLALYQVIKQVNQLNKD
ncbi:AtpZ/AtpI family protein [Myroides marinus]|uniref:AtpZ/AtpI family protein n=1 Tax=Myroides marinus TaxID=703342 RepID=UPI002576F2C1|nr:AtpZ/AtpI family protein [Myroides marinus]MDM1346348.1 AtpZ/AtpI family protein [Myroides marinus]MDM1351056.1 AtpZ/AtpI family protein [Myroides marinus]MDM1353947.1 AtpZ/AtpI family protein [Myroides marinus]MDM1358303.1 AtpZ/AtpI family protein [Myroides marinus]MDM1360170.1 AtpZ/AtpI family protein [Myroides marinus]